MCNLHKKAFSGISFRGWESPFCKFCKKTCDIFCVFWKKACPFLDNLSVFSHRFASCKIKNARSIFHPTATSDQKRQREAKIAVAISIHLIII